MNYIKLTPENLQEEHICCAISGNNDPQVKSKKEWLSERFSEGLVFLKSEQRGKCFIEYIPAEYAWAPIEAEGYMFINCFWVSGSMKGQGYGNDLLSACIADSREKGKKGICVISSPKKISYLSDPDYLKYKGFSVCDSAKPYFDLLYLPFFEDAQKPRFCEKAKNPKSNGEGFVVYYTSGCPFTAKYVPLIEEYAKENDIKLKCIHIDTQEKARNAATVWTNYAVFYNGEFVTHEILNEKRLQKIADSY